jgi:Dihydroprymidine dehydrogenase domain II, 4Fe-4S cluster
MRIFSCRSPRNWTNNVKYACPVHTDARGYVRAIAAGDYESAYLIARGPNPLTSCGRICGAPCEEQLAVTEVSVGCIVGSSIWLRGRWQRPRRLRSCQLAAKELQGHDPVHICGFGLGPGRPRQGFRRKRRQHLRAAAPGQRLLPMIQAWGTRRSHTRPLE